MEKIYKNRYAISDIHGCANTFYECLSKISFSKDDALYITGDFISRGKHSKKVVNTIISLQNDGYSVFPIRGNHEQLIISALDAKLSKKFININKRLKNKWLINEDSECIKEKYIPFFKSLPYYYKLESILLSHAGFDFSCDNIFENKRAMLQQRSLKKNSVVPKDITIIHGHTPTSLKKIKRTIRSNENIINIDNGCILSPNKHEGYGNLVCINIDTKELFVQKNID